MMDIIHEICVNNFFYAGAFGGVRKMEVVLFNVFYSFQRLLSELKPIWILVFYSCDL